MKSKVQIIVVGLILILGIFLRTFQLGKVPASPDWDEVALGYNAYSILHTGKDEYGKFMPVVLESFDDYKPAGYAYLVIPFVQAIGLNVVAVRFPSVIFGVVSLIVLYLIIRELLPNGIDFGKIKISKNLLADASMLLFAISPWDIQFSRVAFEAQVGLSINLISILLFLKGLKRPYLLILSFITAAISIYIYQSEKVYVPLLFVLLIAVFFKQFWKISKRFIALSFIAGFLVVLPMLIFILTNPNALTRAKGVSVFSDTTKLLQNNTEKIERDRNNNDYLGLILDNRRVEYLKAFASGYLSHFEPNWLFYRGDELRHQPPFMGLLYIFELPLILVGVYVLIFSNIKHKVKTFIIGYILIAPIPASVTYDVPHAVRAINMLPAPEILSAIGLLYLFSIMSNARSIIKYPVFAFAAILIFLNISYYLNQYFVQMNYYYSKAWQYGWEEAVNYTQEHSKNFDHVVVTNVSPLDQSYMFFLFYTKYDPAKYLAEGGTQSGGFSANHTAFGKFVFRPINWNEDKKLKNTLFLGRPEDLPDNIGKTINYLDGERAIVFSEKHE